MNPDLQEQLDRLASGIIAAQGDAMAAKAVARELLVDIARTQPEPEAYVAELFDRVSARLAPRDPALARKIANGQANLAASAIFRDALLTLQEPGRVAPLAASGPQPPSTRRGVS